MAVSDTDTLPPVNCLCYVDWMYLEAISTIRAHLHAIARCFDLNGCAT